MRRVLERAEASWRIDRSALVIPPQMVVSGREQQNISLVGDDKWLLECAIARPTKAHEACICFGRIADADERELIREYLFLSLNYDSRDNVRGRLGVLKPGSLMQVGNIIRHFLQEVREAGLRLHEIDQPWRISGCPRSGTSHRQLLSTRSSAYGDLRSIRPPCRSGESR